MKAGMRAPGFPSMLARKCCTARHAFEPGQQAFPLPHLNALHNRALMGSLRHNP